MCIYGVYGLFMDIYEHLCSNLQFISLPEEVGEFLLYIMLKDLKTFFAKIVIIDIIKFVKEVIHDA